MFTQTKNSVSAVRDASIEKAEILIREYKKKRWVQNSGLINKPDSLSAWYSIEAMENFLAVAKANGGDGIKFYYGAYPENYSAKPEYAGRQTLVSVATKSRIANDGTTANKEIYVTKKGRANHLTCFFPNIICPPQCNSNSEGGMGDLGITIIDQGDKGMEIV